MASGLRRLLISVLLGLLPMAASAQDTGGGDSGGMLGPSGIFGQGQGQGQGQAPQPGIPAPQLTPVAPPSIGNTLSPSQIQQLLSGRPADQQQQLLQLIGRPGDQQLLQPDNSAALERMEFQDFVLRSTGVDLPIFGSNLFTKVPTTFAPVDNVPVTSDYVIGPGDQILIRAAGQLDVDLTVTVDRFGAINIPRVGSVSVAGIKYQDLKAHLNTAIGRNFRNFVLTVSMGQLRSIQVFVVGQARRPGSYTVSSMSTLVNAVFAAGGPSVKGSMRHIELKRGSNVITEFDLYDLLKNGDKSKDAPLLPGDVIYFAPVGSLVAISGSVNVPAIFELRKDASLAELIGWAGGLASTASDKKAIVERIDSHKTRQVAEFKLDAPGLLVKLRDGDVVSIASVGPRIENAVTLRGNVATPARYPWREGMRIRDLIPNAEVLISNTYWQRKNQHINVDPEHLGSATVAQGAAQGATQGAAQGAAQGLLAQGVAQGGPIQGLGIGEGAQSGGREAVGTKRAEEITRNLNEVNWEYAVIERMNPKDLSTTLVPFDLGKAVLEGDPVQNILLQAGDIVTIFSVDDVQVPVVKQTKYVRLEGEFKNPGLYSAEPGETLRQLVSRVGGLSPNAYLFGAEYTRESLRQFQQKKLAESIDRLERDMLRAGTSRARNAISPDDTSAQDLQAQRALVARLREVKATGRIVLELAPGDLAAGLREIPDIALEDGDRLIVPSRPSTVNVVGSVYNENAFIFKPEKRLVDYLRQAGGVSVFGDKYDVYLLRADGSVISKRQSGWLMSSFEGERLMPGDTIVVPEDVDRQTWTKVLKDYSQMLFQVGLGAAAIKVLKQ